MSVSRRRKKRLDQKAKKKYTKLWGEIEDMGKHRSSEVGVYKYYMDERDFLSSEIPLGEKLVIFERPKVFLFFYISYEKKYPVVITPAGIPSVRDRLPAGTLAKFDKLSNGEFGTNDFKVYGVIDEKDNFFFYDIKINENYINWIDFSILMAKYDIPSPKNIETVSFKDFNDFNSFLIGKNKGFDDYFYRPILEPIPELEDRYGTTYSATAPKREKNIIVFPTKEIPIVPADDGKGKEIVLVSGENENGANKTGPFCEIPSRQENSGKTTTKSSTDIEGLEDIDFSDCILPDIDAEDLEEDTFDPKFSPMLTCSLFDDLGEIDDTILDIYFDYYTQNKYLCEIKEMFAREALDIADYNKTFLAIVLKEYLVDKIMNFLADFEGCDASSTHYESLQTIIGNRITFKVNRLVNSLIVG